MLVTHAFELIPIQHFVAAILTSGRDLFEVYGWGRPREPSSSSAETQPLVRPATPSAAAPHPRQG